MKTRHFLSSMFLSLLFAAPAFASGDSSSTSERDALAAELESATKARQYDVIVEKALALYSRADSATLKKPSRSSLPYAITEAKLRKAGKSDYASVVSQVAADRAEYNFGASVCSYEYNVIMRLNSEEAARGFVAAYKAAGKSDSTIFTLVYSMIRNRQRDIAAAFHYAVECNSWKHIVSSLQAPGVRKLTDDDSGLLFKAINTVLDDPNQVIDLGFAKNASDKSLLNLYTTGKISKEQFVSTLKKLYQRTYMGLSSDREKWEPVIASIKSLIVNADKINDFAE